MKKEPFAPEWELVNEHSITLWQTWLMRERKVFGRLYELSSTRLRLEDMFSDLPAVRYGA